MTTMIDEILEKGLGHDEDCNIVRWDEYPGDEMHSERVRLEKEHLFGDYECTCGADKRRKYLERLKEPTPEMREAAMNAMLLSGPAGAHKAMLAKAEEGL